MEVDGEAFSWKAGKGEVVALLLREGEAERWIQH
jgi:hypothetical protein